jgi:hypothetical protein
VILFRDTSPDSLLIEKHPTLWCNPSSLKRQDQLHASQIQIAFVIIHFWVMNIGDAIFDGKRMKMKFLTQDECFIIG